MIRPGKYTNIDQSILGLGARLLVLLATPKTIYGLWQDFKATTTDETYPRFVAALDLLYAAGAVTMQGDPIRLIRMR